MPVWEPPTELIPSPAALPVKLQRQYLWLNFSFVLFTKAHEASSASYFLIQAVIHFTDYGTVSFLTVAVQDQAGRQKVPQPNFLALVGGIEPPVHLQISDLFGHHFTPFDDLY